MYLYIYNINMNKDIHTVYDLITKNDGVGERIHHERK